MKIKYITNVRIPTSRAQGYAIMKMCEEFSKLGAGVELVVPNRRNNEFVEDPFLYYGIKSHFPIKKIKSIDLLGPYEAFGKLFYWIDMVSFLLSLVFSTSIKKGEVIYTRDYLVPLVFSNENFICVEIHDIPKSNFLFRHMIRKTKLFFVLNDYLRQALIKRGVDASRIHIVPSGIDLEVFKNDIEKSEACRKTNLSVNQQIVMYTGHFYDWKGIYTLADAANQFPEKLFVFVGGVEPELSKFTNKYREQKNIIVKPFVGRELIPHYLKSADILVVPNSAHSTISSLFTSPLKLFEYMASGRPIIASDLPSLREILNDKNCVFAKPDDTSSFALAIDKIFKNEKLGYDLAQTAVQNVEQYSWTKRADKILKLIQSNLK